MALTGQAPSPANRIAAFMDRETIVDGVPLRVVELTGEPGDMVFCHLVMVHCAAPEPGHPAALHADQDAGSHLRGTRAAQQIATSAPIESRERSRTPAPGS